jgi:uncharacterized membrane protein
MASRIVSAIFGIMLIFVLVGGVVMAQEPTLISSPDSDNVKSSLSLVSKYPALTGESGDSFQTDVDVKYTGEDRQRIDLTITTPKDWRGYATAGYPERQISAVELGPATTYEATETVKINFYPIAGYFPDPGDYLVTVEAVAGDLKSTIDITATVTDIYELAIATDTGRYNTEITAGDEGHFGINLLNMGSADLEDVTFVTDKPEGWEVKYNPDKVDSVESMDLREVDLLITAPAGKTIAGDYIITITAKNNKVTESIDLRVTVLTPSIWGWVGVGIVVVVIIGLAVVFRQLGRR